MKVPLVQIPDDSLQGVWRETCRQSASHHTQRRTCCTHLSRIGSTKASLAHPSPRRAVCRPVPRPLDNTAPQVATTRTTTPRLAIAGAALPPASFTACGSFSPAATTSKAARSTTNSPEKVRQHPAQPAGAHHTSERERLKDFESIDYLPANSSMYREWLSFQPHRRVWDRWFMMAASALP